MKLHVIRRESELQKLRTPWGDLLNDCASGTIFLTWEWSRERAAWEVSECKRRIEQELQNPVHFFSYPNGRAEDFAPWNKDLLPGRIPGGGNDHLGCQQQLNRYYGVAARRTLGGNGGFVRSQAGLVPTGEWVERERYGERYE